MKPENVYLVTREGRADFVKVLDFGIAKMSALDEGGSRLTRTGMIFGTPEYMSPEQAKGDKPDHRVDIYAAGCILYEMLTGDVPFHAETFMGVLDQAHVRGAAAAVAAQSRTRAFAADVEQVCMKALAKDRDQRFQTMKELALALEACVGGDVSQAWGNEPSGVPRRRAARAVAGVPHAGHGRRAATVGSPQRDDAAAPKKRGSALLVGGALALLARRRRGGGGADRRRSRRAAEAGAGRGQPVAETAKPVETPKPVEPPRPTQFTMAIATQPSGAEVFNGAERLGTTPCNVVLPASEKPVELMLKKKGWKDQPLKIVPDRDHDFVADLMPASHSSHASTSPKGAKSTAPVAARPETPTAKPETPTAKPEAAKPAGKLRDLKDPFAN